VVSKAQHDLALPKGSFRLRRIEHRHLAIILAGWKLIETELKLRGTVPNRSVAAGVTARLCFEHICLPLVKAHKGDERLRCCSSRLVGLEVDI
jgi:hypothetical protein